VHLLDILGTCTPIPFCIVTNICHKVTELTWHHNITLCTARNNSFEELFRGITLDDVFDDVTSTKTRNKVRRIKTAGTLVPEIRVVGTDLKGLPIHQGGRRSTTAVPTSTL